MACRGPILEVIVSRMRYIATQTEQPIRFVGLSTALANAADLATWLGIGSQVRPCWCRDLIISRHAASACRMQDVRHAQGLFNFKPSVRPVPLECHIQGFPGKFYCPRMATMNKPAYAAIQVRCPAVCSASPLG